MSSGYKNKLFELLKNRETLMYLIFGVFNSAISIALFKICRVMGCDVAVSNTISTIVAVLLAYITNKIWVFRAKAENYLSLLKEFFSFVSGRIFTYIIETVLIVALINKLGFWDLPCKVFTTFLVVVMNYFISKFLVFKGSEDI